MISKKLLILITILILSSSSKASVYFSGSWGLSCHSLKGGENIYQFNATGGIQN